MAAPAAGATVLKPVRRSFWGYGGTLRAPDGTAWKVATSARKDPGPVAKDVRFDAEGTGSHRIVLAGDLGPFTDPDGFAWEAPVPAA